MRPNYYSGQKSRAPVIVNPDQRGEPGNKYYYSHYEGQLKCNAEGKNYNGDDEVVDAAIERIHNRPADQPLCMFLGLIYPHTPYRVEEPYFSAIDRAKLPKRVHADDCTGKPLMESEIRKYAGMQDFTDADWDELRAVYLGMCMKIDVQFGKLVEALKEEGIYDDCAIFFLSDHGDMLFDHDMVAKRCFYEQSAKIPLIFTGKPVVDMAGTVRHDLAEMADVMPTILQMCGLPIPSTVEGKALFDASLPARDFLFGEIGEDKKATRMVRRGDYKFIYYPCGNVKQLFDLKNDPTESHDLAGDAAYAALLAELEALMIPQLHGMDLDWVHDGRLVGYPAPEYRPTPTTVCTTSDGYHWPPPTQC